VNVPSGRFELPAYELRVVTPWGYSYEVTWDESVIVGCTTANVVGGSPRLNTTAIGCPAGQAAPLPATFQWQARALAGTASGVPLDLRLHGQTLGYRQHSRVRGGGDFSTPGSGLQRYWDPTGTQVWVPVVEVQTIARPN
jgi:hypothetical protein